MATKQETQEGAIDAPSAARPRRSPRRGDTPFDRFVREGLRARTAQPRAAGPAPCAA
ncbi:MAG: hypothetical protein R3E53_06805 [Myxococcota bacterium]